VSTDPLRAALRDAAPEPSAERDLVAAVASRVRRHQRRRRAAAGAVGVACALALVAVVIHRSEGSHTVKVAAPTSSHTVSVEPPLAPCATRGPQIGTLPHRTGGAFDRSPLVTPGATAIQVCRYAGLDELQPVRTLAGSAPLRGVSASVLLADIRRLALVDPGLPTPLCPADEGAVDTVTLRYDHRPAVHLTVQLDGCSNVTDGTRLAHSYGPTETVFGSQTRLQRELAAAVGEPWIVPDRTVPYQAASCFNDAQPSQLPPAGTTYLPWSAAAHVARSLIPSPHRVRTAQVSGWFTCWRHAEPHLGKVRRGLALGISADRPVWLLTVAAPLWVDSSPSSGAVGTSYQVVVDAVTGRVLVTATS
jgi:hypothetical protein